MPSRHLSGDSYDYRWIDDDHPIAFLGRRLPWRRAPPAG